MSRPPHFTKPGKKPLAAEIDNSFTPRGTNHQAFSEEKGVEDALMFFVSYKHLDSRATALEQLNQSKDEDSFHLNLIFSMMFEALRHVYLHGETQGFSPEMRDRLSYYEIAITKGAPNISDTADANTQAVLNTQAP